MIIPTSNARGMIDRNGPGIEILRVFTHNVVYRKDGVQGIAPKTKGDSGDFFVVDGKRIALQITGWRHRRRVG